MEVLAGDDPRDRAERLVAVVLLSNVTDIPRIEALQDQGIEARENIEQQQAAREAEIEDLFTDDQNALDQI